jgi:hypothetical protein
MLLHGIVAEGAAVDDDALTPRPTVPDPRYAPPPGPGA